MNGCICVSENAFDSYFYQPRVGCVHIQSYKCEIGYYQPRDSTSSSSSYGSFSSSLSSAFSSASSQSSSRTILDCQECTSQSTDK